MNWGLLENCETVSVSTESLVSFHILVYRCNEGNADCSESGHYDTFPEKEKLWTKLDLHLQVYRFLLGVVDLCAKS